MNIEIIDSIICKTDRPDLLRQILYITTDVYKKNIFDETHGKKRNRFEKEVSLVSEDGIFLAGFLPRVLENFPKAKVTGFLEKLKYKKEINPPGITLFEDQIKQIIPALVLQRGTIKAPTGTGKTILMYALIHAFSPCKVLVLVPLKSILTQTYDELKKFGLNVSMVGDGKKDLSGDVVVALPKTLMGIGLETYCDMFDVIIQDECHNTSSLSGMYHKILTTTLAIVKLGLTATVKKPNSEKAMACEGLIGPVITEFTIQEAVRKGTLAMPSLKLIPVPKNSNIRELTRYKDIYDVSIIHNRIRNSLAAKYIKEECIPKGHTAIIFTQQVEHAKMILEILISKGIKSKIVYGEIKSSEREIIKRELEQKIIDCVIATSAWREGVNVKSLSVVINCAGYRDATPVVQMAGRCLRIIKGEKEEATVVDFLDIGKYISEHCVERIQTYKSLGFKEE